MRTISLEFEMTEKIQTIEDAHKAIENIYAFARQNNIAGKIVSTTYNFIEKIDENDF